MGLSVGIAIFGLIASGIGQLQQMKQAKKASRRAAEANKIKTAGEKNKDARARRRAIREERVRRARILQLAGNTGALGSGALASSGALSTNTAAALAGNAGDVRAAEGVSSNLQAAANLRASGAQAAALGNFAAAVATQAGKIAQTPGLFDTLPKTTKKTDLFGDSDLGFHQF